MHTGSRFGLSFRMGAGTGESRQVAPGKHFRTTLKDAPLATLGSIGVLMALSCILLVWARPEEHAIGTLLVPCACPPLVCPVPRDGAGARPASVVAIAVACFAAALPAGRAGGGLF